MIPLLPLTRPDGRVYRPRRVIAVIWDDPDEYRRGVTVFGTHDVERSRVLATKACGYFFLGYHAVKPVRGWWRDTIRDGERTWVYDEVRGRAGVSFTASDDPEEPDG